MASMARHMRVCHAHPAKLPSRRMSIVAKSTPNKSDTSAFASYCQKAAGIVAAGVLGATLLASSAMARPEGVNRPELLPKGEFTPVIDVANFLAPSEEKRIRAEVESLERDTGYKLRVLAQNYPETPGLAVKDYWAVDDNSIVFVADPTFANILNFNVGSNVDFDVPKSFWSRLAGKYGNKFYWQEKGEAASIMNAVSAIDTCLREPAGRFKCSNVQGEFGEEPSSGVFGEAMGKLVTGLP